MPNCYTIITAVGVTVLTPSAHWISVISGCIWFVETGIDFAFYAVDFRV